MSRFEGSYLGDCSRIDARTVLECGVCWWVYDPSVGDEVWQVAAGTAFNDLPEYWRCPNCDAAPEQFMVIDGAEDGAANAARRPERAAGAVAMRRLVSELRAAYASIDDKMRSLPVYNEALDIRMVGFRRWEQGWVGIVATPWCMNLTIVPPEGASRRVEGSTRQVDFPSGSYEFIAGQAPGFGPIEICSLFSPMGAFDDPEVVDEVARHCIDGLFEVADARGLPPETTRPQGSRKPISRRRFLRAGAPESRTNSG